MQWWPFKRKHRATLVLLVDNSKVCVTFTSRPMTTDEMVHVAAGFKTGRWSIRQPTYEG